MITDWLQNQGDVNQFFKRTKISLFKYKLMILHCACENFLHPAFITILHPYTQLYRPPIVWSFLWYHFLRPHWVQRILPTQGVQVKKGIAGLSCILSPGLSDWSGVHIQGSCRVPESYPHSEKRVPDQGRPAHRSYHNLMQGSFWVPCNTLNMHSTSSSWAWHSIHSQK